MRHTAKVYIILLNYKGWADTIECLTSLMALDYQNYQVVVVDNDSPDQSFERLASWAGSYFGNTRQAFTLLSESEAHDTSRIIPETELSSRVILIKAEANRGFAAGNNIAMKYALGKSDFSYLWLLNNDTTTDEKSLTALVAKATAQGPASKKVGIWGAKLLFYHNPTTIQAIGGKFNGATLTTRHIAENFPDTPALDTKALEADYIVGASMFVSKDFVAQVGLLDENYFLYFEELDWATRGRQKGFELGYVPESRVFHKEGQSIGSSSNGARKSELADYHGVRSKIYFVKKFYPQKKPLLYLLLLASAGLRLSRLQFKRAKSILWLMFKRSA